MRTLFSRVVLASGNAGKLREFQALFAPLGVECLAQQVFNVPETDEPFDTFLENALKKARWAAQHTGLPALADDSGICIPALNGAPGVLSARFAGVPRSDAANNQKLVEALRDSADRRAYYYCVLVLVRHAHDPQPIVADGVWRGAFSDQAHGGGGFGYDPHFWLPEHACTVAQLPAEEKSRLSHRAQAMAALLDKVRSLS